MKLSAHQEDLLLLKWPALWLVVALLAGAIWYGGSYRFGEENNRLLRVARANRMQAIAAVRQIEEEAGIVRDFCDRYRQLQDERVIGDEDRLELVESVGRIRARYSLYPMQLDIEQQATLPLGQAGGSGNPGESVVIRASRVVIGIPLLHEEDFVRLFDGLNTMKQGIIVTEECAIKRIGGDLDNRRPELRQNLNASCKLLWLTMSRETGVGAPGMGIIPPDPSPK